MSRNKMSRSIPALILAGLLALASPALTFAHGDAEEAATAIRNLSAEERLRLLEERQAEIYHTLAEKKGAGLAAKITERITISGLLEVEAAAADVEFKDGTSDAASDLALATAQFGLGVKLTEAISGDIIFLFEEGAFGADDTDLEVDEAAINFAHGPWSGRVGRQYLPFGVFHSHFISDPLTLELGETRETALLAGYTYGPATLSAFVFNGDAEKTRNEDHIRDWGASLVVAPTEGVELGGSYLSDLADTDA
ncbi:MAG TPA: LbtU family siderophore porin, partial [Desulfuromonadales bacterium]|nr:LbtU family siderophore porin [Desulfuromonadales bacterium]